MFTLSDGFGPFLLPPPRFSRVPCFPEHLARILSLFVLNASSLSVSVYSSDPLQRLFTHRPSVGKLPTLRLTADQCPLLVSCPAYHMQVCAPPPPTCAAGGTWFGCGWRGEGESAPRDGIESLDVSAGIAQVSVPSLPLDFPLRFLWCLSLCLTPPPPFPFNHTCPYTLPPNGRVFSWSLRAPLTSWTRPSCWLHSRLRAPSVSPPPPYLFHRHHLWVA